MLTFVTAGRIQNTKVQTTHQEILCIPVWIILFQSSILWQKAVGLRPTPRCITTHCRFPEPVYSIYFQLPSFCNENSDRMSSSCMALQTNLIRDLSLSGFRNPVHRKLIGLGRGIGPSQGLYIHRTAKTQRGHTSRVDFEQRSQCSSGKRQYTPYTAPETINTNTFQYKHLYCRIIHQWEVQEKQVGLELNEAH
jgi:hypothetical protein